MITQWRNSNSVYTTNWQGTDIVIRRENAAWRARVNGALCKGIWNSPHAAMTAVDTVMNRIVRARAEVIHREREFNA